MLISLTLGNNGLFNKAKLGKELYANAQDYEETEIAKAANSVDGYVDADRGTVTISQEEYNKFSSDLKEAQMSLENKDEKVAEVYNSIEKNLILVESKNKRIFKPSKN